MEPDPPPPSPHPRACPPPPPWAPPDPGVLIRSVAPASNEAALLAPDDVLVAVDGVEVGSDGSVPFRCRRAGGCAGCAPLARWWGGVGGWWCA